MPEQPDQHASVSLRAEPARGSSVSLADSMRDTPGLATLLAEAEATWRARAAAAGETVEDGMPGWRAFEDAFPTFYEFTNRPR